MWSTRPAVSLLLAAACAGSASTNDSGGTTSTTSTTPSFALDLSSILSGQDTGRAGASVAFLSDHRLVVGAPSSPYGPDESWFSDDVVYVTEGGQGSMPWEVPAIVVNDSWPEGDPNMMVNQNGFGGASRSGGHKTPR